MKKIFNFQLSGLGNRGGSTLAELIVAIGLFSVIVTIAIGGFVRALRTQTEVKELIAVNSNASLVIEGIARDLRTGRQFCASANSSFPDTNQYCNPQASLSGDYSTVNTLVFYDASGNFVAYCAVGAAIRKNNRVSSGFPVCDETMPPITSDNVSVKNLFFLLHGNQTGDGYTPRITISLTLSPSSTDPALSGNLVRLQTTVSSREPDY